MFRSRHMPPRTWNVVGKSSSVTDQLRRLFSRGGYGAEVEADRWLHLARALSRLHQYVLPALHRPRSRRSFYAGKAKRSTNLSLKSARSESSM